MPDTIVDPPPPPTVPDPGAAPPARSSRAGCVVVAVLALLIAVAGAAAVYVFFWRYEPHAREHLPDRVNLAVRIEAADFVLFKPVRTHLWPLLDDEKDPGATPPPPAPGPKKKSRLARIADSTGVNLATDVREFLVASVDAHSWVLIVGGRLHAGRFVRGLHKVLEEDGVAGLTVEGELLLGPAGIAIGQAEDGTIVIGTDRSIVTAALPASDAWKEINLPEKGAVTMAVTQAAWKGVSSSLGEVPGADALRKVDRASGTMTLGDAPALSLDLVTSGDGDALQREVEALFAALRLGTLFAPDHYGEKRALGAAKVGRKGANVTVAAPWPLDGLDRACAELANAIRVGRGTSQ